MTEPDADLDLVFQALMHGTRRDMLRRLGDGELSVGELAAPLPVSLAAASKHVQVLERAGLIRRTVVGRRHLFHRDAHRLAAATGWLTGQAQTDAAAPAAPGKKALHKKASHKKASHKKDPDKMASPPKPAPARGLTKPSGKKAKDDAKTGTKAGTKTGKGAKKGKTSRPGTGKAAKKRSGKKSKRSS